MKNLIFCVLFSTVSFAQQETLNSTYYWLGSGMGYGASNNLNYVIYNINTSLNINKHILDLEYSFSEGINDADIDNSYYFAPHELNKHSFGCSYCVLPNTKLNEYNLKYGVNIRKENIGYGGAIGIGYIRGWTYQTSTYDEVVALNYSCPCENSPIYIYKTYQSVNLPISADFYWYISKLFGLRFRTYLKLNSTQSNYGGDFTLIIGKLR